MERREESEDLRHFKKELKNRPIEIPRIMSVPNGNTRFDFLGAIANQIFAPRRMALDDQRSQEFFELPLLLKNMIDASEAPVAAGFAAVLSNPDHIYEEFWDDPEVQKFSSLLNRFQNLQQNFTKKNEYMGQDQSFYQEFNRYLHGQFLLIDSEEKLEAFENQGSRIFDYLSNPEDFDHLRFLQTHFDLKISDMFHLVNEHFDRLKENRDLIENPEFIDSVKARLVNNESVSDVFAEEIETFKLKQALVHQFQGAERSNQLPGLLRVLLGKVKDSAVLGDFANPKLDSKHPEVRQFADVLQRFQAVKALLLSMEKREHKAAVFLKNRDADFLQAAAKVNTPEALEQFETKARLLVQIMAHQRIHSRENLDSLSQQDSEVDSSPDKGLFSANTEDLKEQLMTLKAQSLHSGQVQAQTLEPMKGLLAYIERIQDENGQVKDNGFSSKGLLSGLSNLFRNSLFGSKIMPHQALNRALNYQTAIYLLSRMNQEADEREWGKFFKQDAIAAMRKEIIATHFPEHAKNLSMRINSDELRGVIKQARGLDWAKEGPEEQDDLGYGVGFKGFEG